MIRKAYEAQSRKYHQDEQQSNLILNSKEEEEAKVHAVRASYGFLLSSLRYAYDRNVMGLRLKRSRINPVTDGNTRGSVGRV
jgi:DnaJ-class molecular chaperone